MKQQPMIPVVGYQNWKDSLLENVLRKCGTYYHPPDLFFQELWRDRLRQIGCRVLLVQKLEHHDVWEVRVCMTLTSQTYLLMSKPVPKPYLGTKDVLIKQLRSEIQATAKDLGAPIRNDSILVVRNGTAHFQSSFIWPLGRPGRLLKKEKPAEAFSFLIRPWLRRTRN